MSIAPEALATTELTATRPLALFWERLRQTRSRSPRFSSSRRRPARARLRRADHAGRRTSAERAVPRTARPAFGTPTGPVERLSLRRRPGRLGRLRPRALRCAGSLTVAIVGTGIALLIGATLGTLAGYYRGVVDTIISRTVDVFLAFPLLLLALGISSACSLGQGCAGGLIQPGITTVIGIIVLFSWTYFARLARGQVLSMREKEYVEAARATGAGDVSILAREILPNLLTPLLVYTTLVIPLNILLEAALSYLGVGINPPQASWGQMIAEATPSFESAWWYFLFPGLALVLTVLAFNLLGEAIRDALDPHTRNA